MGPAISIRFVGMKEQMADIFYLGCFHCDTMSVIVATVSNPISPTDAHFCFISQPSLFLLLSKSPL